MIKNNPILNGIQDDHYHHLIQDGSSYFLNNSIQKDLPKDILNRILFVILDINKILQEYNFNENNLYDYEVANKKIIDRYI